MKKLLALTFVLTMIFLGCDNGDPSENRGKRIEVIGYQTSAEVEYGFVTITVEGTAKALKKLDYVQITFTVFNQRGEKVSDILANTASLRAGQTWRFQGITFEPTSLFPGKKYSVKINEIVAF